MNYSLLKVQCGAELTHTAPSHIRASVISVNSLVARVGMLMSLLFLNQILRGSQISYQYLYMALGVVSLIFFGSIRLLRRMKIAARM